MTTTTAEPVVLARSLRQRRRPGLMALGIVLTVVGAMVAFALVTRASGTTQVVAVRHAMARGAVIGPGDLMSVEVPANTTLDLVSADKINELVGKTAQVDLLPDQLMVPQAYGSALVPESGRAIVGVVPNLAPQQAMKSGDKVRLIFSPPQAGDLPEVLRAWDATVVRASVGGADGDELRVDVEVAGTDADVVGAAAATGRLAVVLVPGDSR